MQRLLKQFVCARVLVSLDGGGKPKDSALAGIWGTCKVGGVPSVAVLTADGQLLRSETGPSQERVEEAMALALEKVKRERVKQR